MSNKNRDAKPSQLEITNWINEQCEKWGITSEQAKLEAEIKFNIPTKPEGETPSRLKRERKLEKMCSPTSTTIGDLAEKYCEDNLIARGSFDEMIAEKAFKAAYTLREALDNHTGQY